MRTHTCARLIKHFSLSKQLSPTYFILFLCLAAVHPQMTAQVGIRTETPQGMFHVDALSDTQGYQYAGDDVIVTYNGNLAIGMIPPPLSSIKLIVTDGGTAVAPKSPLRIVDGNQGEGKVLTSDADGRGRWAELPAGFSLGESYGLHGIAGLTTAASNSAFTDLGFLFTANAAGRYAFEIRWWGRVQNTTAAGMRIYQHFRLMRGNSAVDQFEAYTNTIGNAQDICTTSFVLYSEATQGQTFTLQVRAALILQTENNPSTLWTRAWINIIRMY
jgi:hypothetical protein